MPVELKEYAPAYERELKEDIIALFALHGGLVGQDSAARAEAQAEAAETLASWQADGSALYVIREENTYVGFLRLEYRGSQVAWIEDLYVRPEHRGRGLASRAIGLAEELETLKPGLRADFLILEANPLEDLMNLRKQRAVYHYGKKVQLPLVCPLEPHM